LSQPVQISDGWVAAAIAAIVFDILYPLALGLYVRRRLGVSWRFFGYGALIFVLFQLISRVPITLAIQSLIAPQLQASRAALIAWVAVSALTAGAFEEVGRYVGYRWLMRRDEKTWARGVMYGIGHGGIESMLFVAGLTAITLIQVLALARTDLSTLPLTAEQRALAEQQLAAIAAQPSWVPLLGAWERLWTIPVHVALSVVVLQVFLRGSLRWLWLAILAHTLIDLLAAGVTPILGLTGMAALLVPEAIVTLIGLISLWVIWALRDRSDGAVVPAEAATPGAPPLAAEAEPPGDM
jgi:uncharacterized membrane protein YhfC